MKIFTTVIGLACFVAPIITVPFSQVPFCTSYLAKDKYICPKAMTPPICKFDPAKGEYVCLPMTASKPTRSTEFNNFLINVAAAKCGKEWLHKCTRERQGSVCKNGQWEVVHRCATGQQCDMKDGNFCCRIRGPGLSC